MRSTQTVLRPAPTRVHPSELGPLWGDPVGVDRVLADAERRAHACDVPGSAAVAGFAWGQPERTDEGWWPQGITTLDPGTDGSGRTRLAVSWHARNHTATRITLVDRADGEDPLYRHVDLVVAVRDVRGRPRLRAVRTHAGGLALSGRYLFVASTRYGIRVFDLDGFVATPSGYVLPQVLVFRARRRCWGDAMRYSFLDLADDGALVAGEYGRSGGSHRLVRFSIDPSTNLFGLDAGGRVRPQVLHVQDQAERMQGATVVDGTWFVTTSQGRGRPGDLWTGIPGDLTRFRGVLPTGPEDVTYDRRTGRLWSLTEWPGRRWVFAMDPGGRAASPPPS